MSRDLAEESERMSLLGHAAAHGGRCERVSGRHGGVCRASSVSKQQAFDYNVHTSLFLSANSIGPSPPP